jgi:hypothetical protein
MKKQFGKALGSGRLDRLLRTVQTGKNDGENLVYQLLIINSVYGEDVENNLHDHGKILVETAKRPWTTDTPSRTTIVPHPDQMRRNLQRARCTHLSIDEIIGKQDPES